MALPQTVGLFPSPLSFPQVEPAASFGLTADERSLATTIPALQKQPTLFGNAPQGGLYSSQLGVAEWMTQGAVGTDNDPAGWTAEEAQGQTDRALARIAQANPELARELAAARDPQKVEEPDLGFFGNLMRGVGKVLDVTGLDKVLEVISRPAHIIPEFISGMLNGENIAEAAWTGFSDSLMGKSTVSWDDLLVDEFGMERNWLTGVLGFVGDVATDPLTYLTFGLGGVGRAAASKVTAQTAMATVLRGGADDMGRLMGAAVKQAPDVFKTEDDLAKYIFNMTDAGKNLSERAGAGLANRIRKMTGSVHEDASGAVLYLSGMQVESEALQQLLRIGDNAFRAASTTGWNRVTTDAAMKLGIDKAAVDDGLRRIVSQGSGFLPGKAGKTMYMQGRAAGAALGGWRFRVALPMFGVRAQTARIPLIPSRLDFQVGRRFFAGLSGQTRLMKMMGKGEASIDDMRAFWEGGFSGLKKWNPAVHKRLTGGLGNPGSIFYPLSEAVGGVTKHFSAHAMMLRGGGLGAKFAGEVAAGSAHIQQQIADTIRTVELPDGRILNPEQTDQLLVEWSGVGARNPDPVQVTARYDNLVDYSVLVPHAGTRAQKYYDDLIQEEIFKDRMPGGARTDLDRVAELRDAQKRAVALEQRLEKTPGWEHAVEAWRTVTKQAEEAGYQAGIYPHGIPDAPATRDELRPDDAMEWLNKGPEETHDTVFEMTDLTALSKSDGAMNEFVMTDRGADGTVARALHLQERDKLSSTLGSWHERPARRYDYSEANPQMVYGESRLETVAEARRRVELEQSQAGSVEAARRKGPPIVARPLRVYKRDLRTTRGEGELAQATETIDLYSEIEQKMRDILTAVKEGSDEVEWPLDLDLEVTDEIARILEAEDALDEFIAPMVAAEFRARGYDAIRTVKDDATHLAVFLDEGGVLPAAKVNPYAPKVQAGRANPMRAFTQDTLEAVGRRHKAPEGWLARGLRDTIGMGREDAERYLRALLQKKGVNLRGHQAVLETDPVRVMRQVTDEVSKRSKDRYIGRVMQEAEHLGLTRGAWGSDAIGIDRYKYVVNEAGINALIKLEPEVQAASDRAAAYAATEMPAYKQAAEDMATDMNALERDLLDEQEQTFRVIEAHTTESEGSAEVFAIEAASLDDGSSIRYEMVDELMANGQLDDLGNGVYATRGDPLADEAVTYYDIDFTTGPPKMPPVDTSTTAAKKGADELAEAIHEAAGSQRKKFTSKYGAATGKRPSFYIKGFRHADAPNVKSKPMPDGTIKSKRDEGGVIAITGPAAQGQGVGKRLLRVHWANLGITRPKDALKFLESRNASFSEAGRRLNMSAIRDLKDDLLRETKRNRTEELRQLEQELLHETETINELNKIVTRQQTRGAAPLVALVPTENAANVTGFQQLTVPGFEQMHMPAFMAQEFEQAVRGYKTLDGAHRQWRQFNAWWKELATWLWPGFHIRNMSGAWFNNWLGGVDMSDYFMTRRIRNAERELFHGDPASRRWANMKVRAKDRQFVDELRANGTTHVYGRAIDDLTYGDLAAMTGGLGITASNGRAFAEARLTVEAIEKRHGQRAIETLPVVGRAGKWYTKSMRGAGTMTENVFRTAAFVRGLRNSGNIMEARAFTMMRHGDYYDLTDWEYGWIRDLIPFYKWMRTNTPFQIHQLLETPGKLLSVVKAQQQVFTGQSRDYDEEKHKIPDWMKESFIVPFGPGEAFEAVMLDLPMSDLTISGREFISSFLPTIRPFLESYIYEQSTFSGAPLEGKPVQLPDVFRPLGGLLQALNMAQVGEDGGVFIDDKLQNVLGAVPVFSRLRNWLYEDPDRVKLRSNTVASAIFGLGFRPVDTEVMADTELDFYYSQVLPMVEHLKDMGYPLPTTDDLAATVGTTETILRSLGIEPTVTQTGG